MTDEIQDYVENNRESLHYALQEGDRWVRTVVIAALISSGEADAELAKQELEASQRQKEG
ncbi:hypothetical protein [Halorubrum sp. Hd13]|uniref:hypothetical protein n=1 Tax=Halorubrum sp. Hd13 TaxID=1480728 RepID=UPI0011407684|nr:hypothetical protein [Halorubrum sp. Hd13]